MRSIMPVVLKARTTSPGHFLHTSSQFSRTRKALVRIDEAAIFSHGADAIGIAVGDQAGMAFFFHNGFLQQRHVRQNRLGIDPGK